MFLSLAAASLLTLAAAAHTDTTVEVRPGARLELNSYGGSLAVTAWGRSAVRVEADHDARTHILVDVGPRLLTLRSEARLRVPDPADPARTRVQRVEMPAAVDYRLTVPRGMDLRLSSVSAGMTIDGVGGSVEAQTVRGPLLLSGGRGFIRLNAIDGGVRVEHARGRIEVSCVNQGVSLRDVEGVIQAEAVNGDIALERIVSEAVEATTVNGRVVYDGTFHSGGRYRFASHNGDITVFVPEKAGLTVSSSTFSGSFDASFPVRLRALRPGKRFDFVLGDGAAELELESFSGAIRLRRPGERLESPAARVERRVIVRSR